MLSYTHFFPPEINWSWRTYLRDRANVTVTPYAHCIIKTQQVRRSRARRIQLQALTLIYLKITDECSILETPDGWSVPESVKKSETWRSCLQPFSGRTLAFLLKICENKLWTGLYGLGMSRPHFISEFWSFLIHFRHPSSDLIIHLQDWVKIYISGFGFPSKKTKNPK